MFISRRIHTSQETKTSNVALKAQLRHWQLENPPWKCQHLLATGTVSEYFIEPVSRRVKWSSSFAARSSKNRKLSETCIVKRFERHGKLFPIQLYLRDITNLADLLRNEPQYKQYFVELFSVSIASTNIFCALEHMKLGSLENYLDFQWLESDVKMVTEGVLSALQFMHLHQFMHLDLKPTVIFPIIAPNGRFTVKLSDFGVYKRIRFNESLIPEIRQEDHVLQDTTYMAPETFEFGGKNTDIFTPATDCWAVACIIYRLLTGEALFRSPRDIITFTKVGTHLRDILLKRGIGSIGISFISELLQRDPRNRMTAKTALQHPWAQVSSETPSERLKQKLNDTRFDSSEQSKKDVHYYSPFHQELSRSYGRRIMSTALCNLI